MCAPRISAFVLALCIAGCETFDYSYQGGAAQSLSSAVLGNPAPLPPEPVTLWLSDDAKATLDARINRKWNDHYKLNELRELLFDEDELSIGYDANSTKTAMELWETRKGNCLSMTNLFIATARYIGLDAHYETVEVAPTWDHEGWTMIRYEHIIAVGKLDGGTEYVMDFLPEFVVGDREAARISDTEALALYYNNLGAEAVIGGDQQVAVDNLRVALQIDPGFSDAWNNMGAAMRRSGRLELAEYAYRRALQADDDNYSALGNLAQLYQSEGRDREAKHYVERVNWYRQRNPYFHYFVARTLMEEGHYRDAVTLLERSVRLKRDEPDFYEALSRSWARLGNSEKSGDYEALAQKYREEGFRPPPRHHNHRFWVQTVDVN
ncbi:MAG: tetratricopeptide repeat protein [Pseudomonadales bacterium]|nr:tetratricopeptide repeat protein [Pseudomonadales bacterium]